MMREIRDNLSKDFSKLSVTDKINYLKKNFPKLKTKRAAKTSDNQRIGVNNPFWEIGKGQRVRVLQYHM